MSRSTPSGPAFRAESRGRRWIGADLALLTLAGLLVERPAHAAGPEVAELVYDRPVELSSCPDEAAFRRAVSERLGRDPFVPEAARKISVALAQNGVTLTALVRVEEAGRARGERRIDTRAGCAELASGAALAVSIAIDPLVALGLPSQAEPAPEPEPKPASTAEPPKTELAHSRAVGGEVAPKPAASPPRKSERVERRVFVLAGARTWIGVVPELSFGPSFGLGYQRGAWSLALSGFAVLPRSETVPNSRRAVSVGWLGAQLTPCAHFAAFRACARFSSGALLARGEGVDEPSTGASWSADAGIGIGYSFFVGRFFVTPSVDAGARLKTTVLSLDNEPVWTTPRVLGSLGLELGYDVWR